MYITGTVPLFIGVSHATKSKNWLGKNSWNKNRPSSITLYIGDSRNNYIYSPDDFKYVSAHEFGHILGVDDVYDTAVADKVTSIMNAFGTAVQSRDIEKVLSAFSSGKWQKWD